MARSDIKAGSAFVELLLKQQKFRNGLSKATGALKSFAKSAVLISGPLLAAFSFKKIIDSASRLEETMNKFNVVFGENAKTVKNWSDDFAKEVGRSQQAIAQFMASSQDLFVPLGFESGAATEMSKQITGLAVDLASFNDMQDTDTLRDLQAALTGSGEVMKKYGVILSEAAVKQELLNRGLDPKAASDQAKVQARLNIIMAGTTAAQGDAIRSAGSYTNMLKAMLGKLTDVAAAIGTAYLPIMSRVFKVVMQAADGVQEFYTSLFTTASNVVEFVTPVMQAFVSTTADAFSALWETTRSTWTAITNTIMEALGFASSGTGDFLSWIQDAFATALGSISFAITNWKQLLEVAFVSAQLSVVRFGNQVVYFFGTMIPGYLSWFADNWKEVFIDIANVTATIASNIWTNLKNLWDGIQDLFSGNGFTFEWTPLTQGFESAIKELPKIAEREMGPLEASLNDELNKLANEMVNDFDKHQKDFRQSIKKFTPEAIAIEEGQQGSRQIAAAAASAASPRGPGRDVFATFSAAAALAAGQGAGKPEEKIVQAVMEQNRDQKKRHDQLMRKLGGDGLKP